MICFRILKIIISNLMIRLLISTIIIVLLLIEMVRI